ncbi:MAG TPA: 3-phosphoshikimate 1-carboxyvinyltransferase [Rariglobus sp.]|nr:3-phosphoshikimate 1-carboxyvinyltransferase [Rariglobus sp.]
MPPSLPAVLPIQPFTRPVRGEVTLPGSKSLTNRALLLAALCKDRVVLTSALFSEDTHLMVEALKALGFTVNANADAGTIEVSDQANGFKKDAELFVGLAGTAARFLTALCVAAPSGIYRIDGIPQMRKRPMKGLIDALRSLGADVRCTGVEGFFPLEIHAKGLRGGEVAIDASESSQMLSGLLMVAPLADAPISIKLSAKVREPFVQMTKNMVNQFGGAADFNAVSGSWEVAKKSYTFAGTYAIEPDATAASYFTTLPLVTGGALMLLNLQQGLQGDTQFVEVMQRVGLTATSSPSGLEVSFAPGSIRTGISENFNEFSDTFLTLAAVSPLLSGPTRITGIAHSRKQETDRVAGMVRELRKLGQEVDEHADGDGLTITPRPLTAGVEIETYGDHRFAMSFGILGCHDLHGDGRPWLSIKDPACCAKTFPNFFDVLNSLRPFLIVAIDGGAASGKSSTSRALSERFNFLHVDTGSYYRAITAELLRRGLRTDQIDAVKAALPSITLGTQVDGRAARMEIGGRVVPESEIRGPEVTAAVSHFAAIPEVRSALLTYQRNQADVARAHGFGGMVMEGRDIGSIIFPDAGLRLFLHADPVARAKRRELEGRADAVAERDRLDATRKTAPLVLASGAIDIDSTYLNLEQVVDKISGLITEKLG